MLRVYEYSECGGNHTENEDYVLRARHPSGGQRFLCFVADGQGGRADGAVASRIACESALAAAKNRPWDSFEEEGAWDDVFCEADRSVRQVCSGFTTLIGLAIDEEFVSGASVGDSKVYWISSTGEATELSAGQKKNPPIGAGCNQATAFSRSGESGTLLAVTDGVWKYVGFDAIASAVCSDVGSRTVVDLVESVRASCGGRLPDDSTALVAIS